MPYNELAKAIAERMAHHHAILRLGDEDRIEMLFPAPGVLGRPETIDSYQRGYQDGAMRELQVLVKMLPALRCAIRHQLRKNTEISATA